MPRYAQLFVLAFLLGVVASGAVEVKAGGTAKADCESSSSSSSSDECGSSSSGSGASGSTIDFSSGDGKKASGSKSNSGGASKPAAKAPAPTSPAKGAKGQLTVAMCKTQHKTCLNKCEKIKAAAKQKAEKEKEAEEKAKEAEEKAADKKKAKAQKKQDAAKRRELERKLAKEKEDLTKKANCCSNDECAKKEDDCSASLLQIQDRVLALSSILDAEALFVRQDYEACLHECRAKASECDAKIESQLKLAKNKLKRLSAAQKAAEKKAAAKAKAAAAAKKAGGCGNSNDNCNDSASGSDDSDDSSCAGDDCDQSSGSSASHDSSSSSKRLAIDLPEPPPNDHLPAIPPIHASEATDKEGTVEALANAELQKDLAASRKLSQAIAAKESHIDSTNTWIDNAEKTLHKLKRLVTKTNSSMTATQEQLKDLRAQKAILQQRLHKHILERDLQVASTSLMHVKSKESQIQSTTVSLEEKAGATEEAIESLQKKLQMAIRQFHLVLGKKGSAPTKTK